MNVILEEFRLKNKEVIITTELPLPAIHNLIMACLVLIHSPKCDELHKEVLQAIGEYLVETVVEQCPEYERYLTLLRDENSPRKEESLSMTEFVQTVASDWFIYLPDEEYPETGTWINLAELIVIHQSTHRLLIKLSDDKSLTIVGSSVDILKQELTRLSRQSHEL